MAQKTGILTFHRADNYGAVLQAYATIKILNTRGFDAEIIDYRFPEMEKIYRLFKVSAHNTIIHNFKIILHDFGRILRKYRFFMFRKNRLILSKKYTLQNIRYSNNCYDVFVTGSDQVWNDACSLKEPVYCLTFVDNKKKKFSYAASYGRDKISESRKQYYQNVLEDFTAISVREATGVEITEELIGSIPYLIPDPTLMLDKDEWNKIAKIPRKKGYILIYMLNARQDVLDFAVQLANKTGYEIINITDENRKTIDARYIHNVGPEEFLGLINNAEYVITNSFHGLMFTIIYRKSMYVDIPKGKDTTYSRMTNILNALGIQDRYIEDLQQDFIPKKLNYEEIEIKIQ